MCYILNFQSSIELFLRNRIRLQSLPNRIYWHATHMARRFLPNFIDLYLSVCACVGNGWHHHWGNDAEKRINKEIKRVCKKFLLLCTITIQIGNGSNCMMWTLLAPSTIITLRSHSQCTLCSCWRLLSISFFEYVLKTERQKVSMTHFACHMPMLSETGFIPSSHIMEMVCLLIAKKILNSSSNGPILLLLTFLTIFSPSSKMQTTFLSVSIFEWHQPNNWTQKFRIRPFYSTALSSISFIFSIVKFDSRL